MFEMSFNRSIKFTTKVARPTDSFFQCKTHTNNLVFTHSSLAMPTNINFCIIYQKARINNRTFMSTSMVLLSSVEYDTHRRAPLPEETCFLIIIIMPLYPTFLLLGPFFWLSLKLNILNVFCWLYVQYSLCTYSTQVSLWILIFLYTMNVKLTTITVAQHTH